MDEYVLYQRFTLLTHVYTSAMCSNMRDWAAIHTYVLHLFHLLLPQCTLNRFHQIASCLEYMYHYWCLFVRPSNHNYMYDLPRRSYNSDTNITVRLSCICSFIT